VSGNGQKLRDSLIYSLRTQPQLVEAEEAIHSSREGETRLRGSLAELLDEKPVLLEADGLAYQTYEREVIDRLRMAMVQVLRGGSSLADADGELLESLGLEKMGQFRSSLKADLDGLAEIPEEDLAIYVPSGEGIADSFRRGLAEQLREASKRPETVKHPSQEGEPTGSTRPGDAGLAKPDVLPSMEESLPVWGPLAGKRPENRGRSKTYQMAEIEPTAQAAPKVATVSGVAPTAGGPAARITGQVQTLNPVPMLTAALESVGVEGDGFGFLLRYGRYAPEGRRSEFVVGGMGLAELSERLTSWLEAQGPTECQVQVIDEGSGELTIYLLGQDLPASLVPAFPGSLPDTGV